MTFKIKKSSMKNTIISKIRGRPLLDGKILFNLTDDEVIEHVINIIKIDVKKFLVGIPESDMIKYRKELLDSGE